MEAQVPAIRQEIAAETRRAIHRLSRRLRVQRAPQALSANKISVLGHLYRHGQSAPGEIAVAEHQRPQALTRVFSELEQDGLISRAPSERDGRGSVLDLTQAGRAELVRDLAERDRWLSYAVAELSETEAQVLRLAATVMERLADANPLGAAHRAPENPRPTPREP
jgi:DNA-binding MarR family transcriptional regulator